MVKSIPILLFLLITITLQEPILPYLINNGFDHGCCKACTGCRRPIMPFETVETIIHKPIVVVVIEEEEKDKGILCEEKETVEEKQEEEECSDEVPAEATPTPLVLEVPEEEERKKMEDDDILEGKHPDEQQIGPTPEIQIPESITSLEEDDEKELDGDHRQCEENNQQPCEETKAENRYEITKYTEQQQIVKYPDEYLRDDYGGETTDYDVGYGDVIVEKDDDVQSQGINLSIQ
nr:9496_t:CDS:2 [Entrophospora candida]